ncbi:MAG: YpdA family putative bacillithiol disulfide reductase [Bacteroidota bacterium]
MKVYDLLIIGGGPIGLCCAIEAQKAGLDYVLVEKGVLVNSLYHFPANMTFFSTSKKLEIGDVPFISHADKPTRTESLEYFRRVAESWQLHLKLYEEVKSMKAEDSLYRIDTSKGSYQSRTVIVATGFYDTPRLLGIPGEELPKVKHYYDEVHPYVNQKVVIVGAGNSGCDVALETFHKGADVTMVVRKPHIKPTVKYWIKPNIENRIKEGSVKAYFSSRLLEIRPLSVLIDTPEGQVELENDFVLAMTGYQPNYALLDRLGLTYTEDEARSPVQDPETLESNLPGVYIAGVAAAGMHTSKLFIENTRVHARTIIRQILSGRRMKTLEDVSN